MVLVGGLGCSLQLVVCLVQQLFGVSRVTFHVELVGLLSRGDLFIGVLSQPLCGRQVWVPRTAHVARRLREGEATSQDSQAQGATQKHIAICHAKNLRPTKYQIAAQCAQPDKELSCALFWAL